MTCSSCAKKLIGFRNCSEYSGVEVKLNENWAEVFGGINDVLEDGELIETIVNIGFEVAGID